MGHDPQRVLDLWFPDNGHWTSKDTHMAFWDERMQGGMDEVICRDFAELTDAAARCELDNWAETPRHRLALLIALDQFPRSLWRDTPAAFAQDLKSCRLSIEAIENGQYHAIPNLWERQFYIIAITHCEGPDHLARMDLAIELTKSHIEICPQGFEPMIDLAVEQAERVRNIIAEFGRHPHRNDILGRPSSAAEKAYIATGDFPHLRRVDEAEAAN